MELKITKDIKEANLITHTSTFHPDDVFSTMFLSKIVENPIVARVSSVEEANENAIIYDIGFGKFDHHGVDAKMRNSKIKYCSFGLLWQEFGRDFLKSNTLEEDVDKLFDAIDKKLVMQIDGIDNGLFPSITAEYCLTDLDNIIDSFNKAWNEEIDNDECFLEAVKVASLIFDRLIVREKAKIEAAKIIEQEINKSKDNILILDKHMPYQEALFESTNPKAKDILVVIFPSNRGGYCIKPMTKNKDTKDLICIFDKELHGLHDEELKEKSKIKSARFIHSSGFLGCTDDLEGAILLAKNAIKNKE